MSVLVEILTSYVFWTAFFVNMGTYWLGYYMRGRRAQSDALNQAIVNATHRMQGYADGFRKGLDMGRAIRAKGWGTDAD